MSRPLRIEYPGAYYHVMNRGLGRIRIFLDDPDRMRFLRLIGEIFRLWSIRTYAYCLMDNHYHLLLETPQGNLSRVMRHLDGLYTQSFNRAHHRDGPLFRGRYRAILIDAEEYFLSVARYIHHNPRQAGMVSEIEDYPWSSHGPYLGERSCPSWLSRHGMLARFGEGRKAAKAYHVFMKAGVEPAIDDFYNRRKLGPLLGGKEFLQRVKDKMGERARARDDIPESRLVFAPEVDQIVKATGRVYGKSIEELLKRRRGVRNDARAMAIYLCRALGGHKLSVVAQAVGLKNYSSTSSAYLGMKRRIEKEPSLGRMAREIEETLKSQEQT